MAKSYYIAACGFTSKFPELSRRIQQYIKDRFDITLLRCCVAQYKVKEYEEKIPLKYSDCWHSLQHCADFAPGDTVYSICHNCSNIIEETHPEVTVKSIWELIFSDESFVYPDRGDISAVVQDCWRAKERTDEQDAVRGLLKKMNIDFSEASPNRENTDFCGTSLYRPQPPRNPALAPKHYFYGAEGKFIPHTEEEQRSIMRDHCSRFENKTAICYCHYCLDGLITGGADAFHIAQLLFGE